MAGALLDWALASFAGDVAADELSEGPSGVLSVVDHRQDKRLRYAVLDHDPTPPASTTFVGRLKTALTERDWGLQGLTTDGSPLSPEPIRTVFGAVAHQMCTCHVLKALTQGILRAVAAARRRLARSKPKVKRGRPSSTEKTARRLARTRTQRPEKRSAWFQGRFLCVKRRRKPREHRPLLSITRGLPQ
jgi:hypothetical protein